MPVAWTQPQGIDNARGDGCIHGAKTQTWPLIKLYTPTGYVRPPTQHGAHGGWLTPHVPRAEKQAPILPQYKERKGTQRKGAEAHTKIHSAVGEVCAFNRCHRRGAAHLYKEMDTKSPQRGQASGRAACKLTKSTHLLAGAEQPPPRPKARRRGSPPASVRNGRQMHAGHDTGRYNGKATTPPVNAGALPQPSEKCMDAHMHDLAPAAERRHRPRRRPKHLRASAACHTRGDTHECAPAAAALQTQMHQSAGRQALPPPPPSPPRPLVMSPHHLHPDQAVIRHGTTASRPQPTISTGAPTAAKRAARWPSATGPRRGRGRPPATAPHPRTRLAPQPPRRRPRSCTPTPHFHRR